MESLQSKLNLEAHVWILSAAFKTCKDRTLKNTNYSTPASANASDEEIRQFTNCVTKHFKAIALAPSIVE